VYPDQPFSYAWVNNWGERHASGELLCLLNDDVEVISADWLEQLAARASFDGVGICGAMLYYPNDVIQHAGVILGLNGVAAHQFIGLPRGSAGYCGRAAADQDLSAVTGGCMMVRRSVFQQLGGFNQHLAIAFNDVDFCIRARGRGWRVLWTPVAELYHHESVSVGAAASNSRLLQLAEERAMMQRTWGALLENDPFYNPNLSLESPYHAARWARSAGR
jgi:GT2 family glycosyltransferase